MTKLAPVSGRRIVARAPNDLHKALKIYADQHDTSIEAIVVDLVEQYLRTQNALPMQRTHHEMTAQPA